MLDLVDRLADAASFTSRSAAAKVFSCPGSSTSPSVAAIADRPNVTTSGISLTEEQARRSKIFGRINVSLDGVSESGYGELRRAESSIAPIARSHCSRSITRTSASTPSHARQRPNRLRGDRALRGEARLRRGRAPPPQARRPRPANRGTSIARPPSRTARSSVAPRVRKRHRNVSIKVDCSFAPFVA